MFRRSCALYVMDWITTLLQLVADGNILEPIFNWTFRLCQGVSISLTFDLIKVWNWKKDFVRGEVDVIIIRGHFRNWPKGGSNSPQRYISTRFADHFSQFYSQSVQKPLQGAQSAAFCTELNLIHRLILVWTHKITNFLSQNYFCAGQRVVLRPLHQ